MSAPLQGPSRVSITAWFGLGVVGLIALLGTLDLQIYSLVAEPIKKTLHMSDTALGFLQGVGGILILSLAGFPLAWLADRYDRRLVLAAGVVVWSAASFARGFAGDAHQLLLCTMVLAMGEATIYPCCYGIVPTLFEGKARLVANTAFVAMTVFGSAAAMWGSGAMLVGLAQHHAALPPLFQDFEVWRLAFFIVALPGPLLAFLLLGVRPTKSEALGDAPETRPHVENPDPPKTLLQHLRQHGWAVAGISIASGVVAIGDSLRFWGPIIGTRTYGISPGEVGEKLGVVNLIGLVFGLGLTWAITRRYADRLGPVFALRVIWVTSLISGLLTLALLFCRTPTQFFVLMGARAAIGTPGGMLSPTLLQDLGPPQLRSQLIAIAVVVSALIRGAGPPLVGATSDAMKASPSGLVLATLVVSSVGMAIACLVFALSERSYRTLVQAARPAP